MGNKYARVIVNPVAGGGATGKKWPEIKRQLEIKGVDFDFELTTGKGHAGQIAFDATNKRYSFIIAVGGDGTVNEVANGILSSPNRNHATLGVINTGTGSDYIRTVGTPRDYLAACNFLERKERFLIDVGVVNYYKNGKKERRFFVNYAGTGFDAEVAEATNRMPKPKFISSTIPYVISLLKTLISYRNKTVKLSLDNNKARQGRLLSVIIANGRFIGGGMKIAPEAELDDGKLDVVIINNVGKFELLRAFPRIYSGTHTTHPKVDIQHGCHIEVESVERMPVCADGELLGECPATFDIIPQALAVAR